MPLKREEIQNEKEHIAEFSREIKKMFDASVRFLKNNKDAFSAMEIAAKVKKEMGTDRISIGRFNGCYSYWIELLFCNCNEINSNIKKASDKEKSSDVYNRNIYAKYKNGTHYFYYGT